MIGIRGHSWFMSDQKHLKSLTGQLDLAESIAEYTRANVAAKKTKKEADVSSAADLESFPSRNVSFVDQGYDWKAIGMTLKYYGGSVARGHAADIRAAEVPMEYEVKARMADRKFSGVGYVRNGPPGPVLTLLRSVPPTTGIIVGARGGGALAQRQTVRV